MRLISRAILMIKVATKVKIVLKGTKYHVIFGGKMSGMADRSYDPCKRLQGHVGVKFLMLFNLFKTFTNAFLSA